MAARFGGHITGWPLRVGVPILVVIAIAIVLIQMSFLDRIMVYFPDRELSSTPSEVGLDYEDVYLTTSDGVRIHAWHIPGRSDTTLLWLHGNAGNISNRVDNIAVLHRRTGLGVLIVDYRGYGLSEGRPSESGLYSDAEAAFEYLVTDLRLDPREDIVLFGRSLGAGVAAELAARHAVRCVILESGFTSVRAMAKAVYPSWMVSLTTPLLDARFDTLSKMDRITSPLMIVHGDRDEIVPLGMAEEIYSAAPGPKRLHVVRGATHNDTFIVGGTDYLEALRDFIADP